MSMHEIDLARFDLNLLTVFEALLIERHVGRAAARLHLTQSATSHALGRLRMALGDPLFVRHPKGVEPTQRALTLAPTLCEVLGQTRGIFAPIAPFDPASLKRTFQIGATDHAVLTVLAPLVGRLRDTAPNVDLRVLPIGRTNMAASFDTGRLDIALGSYPETPQRITATRLFSDRYVGIARINHPLTADGAPDIRSIAQADFAMVSLSGDGRSTFDDALEEIGFARRVVVTVPHFLALPFLLTESDMIALMPSRVVERIIQGTSLTVFELPFRAPSLETHLLYSRERRSDPSIIWMARMMSEGAS